MEQFIQTRCPVPSHIILVWTASIGERGSVNSHRPAVALVVTAIAIGLVNASGKIMRAPSTIGTITAGTDHHPDLRRPTLISASDPQQSEEGAKVAEVRTILPVPALNPTASFNSTITNDLSVLIIGIWAIIEAGRSGQHVEMRCQIWA